MPSLACGEGFDFFIRTGGKGVATAAGVILVLTPLAALIAAVLFVAITALTRYVSLGSILAAASVCVIAWLLGHVQAAELYLALAALIIAKHAGNIVRLVKGEENRLSF